MRGLRVGKQGESVCILFVVRMFGSIVGFIHAVHVEMNLMSVDIQTRNSFVGFPREYLYHYCTTISVQRNRILYSRLPSIG